MFSPGAEAIDDRELQWRDQSACDTVLAALWYVHLSGHMVGDDPSWPMMSAYPLRLRSPQKCTEMQIMGFPVVVIDQTDPGKERQVEHCGMIHVCKVTRLRHGKWRRKWLPTPVLLPGEFHGQRSLLGYSPWGRKEWGQDWVTNTHIERHKQLLANFAVLSFLEVFSRQHWSPSKTPWSALCRAQPHRLGSPRSLQGSLGLPWLLQPSSPLLATPLLAP